MARTLAAADGEIVRKGSEYGLLPVSGLIGRRLRGDEAPDKLAALLVDALSARVCDDAALDFAVSQSLREGHLAWDVSRAYFALMKKMGRLRDGVVFTPPVIAELMIDRLIRGIEVVDLGAGTGMLAVSAAMRGFQVVAVESDQASARIMLEVARRLGVDQSIQVIVGDAFEFEPTGAAQILANPPYTRHHQLGGQTKRVLAERSSSSGIRLPRTSSHYAYFMAHAWTADWSVREVLLTPTNWMEASYGRALRDYLCSRENHEIAVWDPRSRGNVFLGAASTACIVTTSGLPTGSHALLRIGDATGVYGLSDYPRMLALRLNGSRHSEKVLQDVFLARRGVATGSNRHFAMTREEARSLGIPQGETIPVIRSLRMVGPDAILWVPGGRVSRASARHIRKGEELGINLRRLCSSRSPWWRICPPQPPDYFISYMGRGGVWVVPNETGAINLNNIHGLYRRPGITEAVAEAVVMWMRSDEGQTRLKRSARHYQGGLWKLEPGDLARLPIPANLIS